MTNYEGARVKLTSNQLSKLKFAGKKYDWNNIKIN